MLVLGVGAVSYEQGTPVTEVELLLDDIPRWTFASVGSAPET